MRTYNFKKLFVIIGVLSFCTLISCHKLALDTRTESLTETENQTTAGVKTPTPTVSPTNKPTTPVHPGDVQIDRESYKFTKIFTFKYAFIGLTTDNHIVGWGDASVGADTSSVDGVLNVEDIVDIVSNDCAMAALKVDGSVVAWGNELCGGNLEFSNVASQLNGEIPVKEIVASQGAFIAIRRDGTVVPWGVSMFMPSEQNLRTMNQKKVRNIYFNPHAVFATLESKEVLAWGMGSYGGNITSKRKTEDSTTPKQDFESAYEVYSDGTDNIKEVIPTIYGFVVLFKNGKVVAWGSAAEGGDIAPRVDALEEFNVPEDDPEYATKLTEYENKKAAHDKKVAQNEDITAKLQGEVEAIYANGRAALAVLKDGHVVSWGNAGFGGSYIGVVDQLKNIDLTKDKIYALPKSFVIVKHDGAVVDLGYTTGTFGGKSIPTHSQSSDCAGYSAKRCPTNLNLTSDNPVKKILATSGLGMCALLEDGSVITWGHTYFGGYPYQYKYNPETDTHSQSYIALYQLVGDHDYGTYTNKRVNKNLKVEDVYASEGSFVAKFNDNSIISWGSERTGGIIPMDDSLPEGSFSYAEVESSTNKILLLHGVEQVYSNGYAFVAKRSDGSFYAWGDPLRGGDNSQVRQKLIGSDPSEQWVVYSNDLGFLVQKADNSAVYWGEEVAAE